MAENAEEFIAGTIDDYLIALADGVVRAQDELNKVAVQGAAGQPAFTYQLPKVDFELKMTFSLERETESKRASSPLRSILGVRKIPLLLAAPVRPESSTETIAANAVSTIKGSFIAVPVNGGKPPNLLAVTVEKETDRSLLVGVRLYNAVGEAIAGETVALAVDRDFSEALNTERGLPANKRKLHAATDFAEGEVVTDEAGQAVGHLNVAAGEDPKVTIVVRATCGDLSESVVYQAEDAE